jgi:pyruvate dehydrogenase E2 component (dihydrolipoamide acetyltransferase)
MISRAFLVARTGNGSALMGTTSRIRLNAVVSSMHPISCYRPTTSRSSSQPSCVGGGARPFSSSSSEEMPYHIVMGLPALSPTMSSGALAEWYVSEGDKFSAGDAVAKIETDKATIDFEAQDDGFVARLLMEAGNGVDIPVGTPIMITVEEEDSIAAFKGYVPPAIAVEAPPVPAAAAAAAATPPPPPVAAVVAPPTPAAAAPAPVSATPPPPPAAPVAASVVSAPAATSAGTHPVAVAWGLLATKASPLAKSLAKKQHTYVDLYGTTGQPPIL